MSKIDIAKVKEEAEKEAAEEAFADAKEQIKEKLREVEDAKKILRNLERELADLYVEVGQ